LRLEVKMFWFLPQEFIRSFFWSMTFDRIWLKWNRRRFNRPFVAEDVAMPTLWNLLGNGGIRYRMTNPIFLDAATLVFEQKIPVPFCLSVCSIFLFSYFVIVSCLVCHQKLNEKNGKDERICQSLALLFVYLSIKYVRNTTPFCCLLLQ
jgi:hypothetical protein